MHAHFSGHVYHRHSHETYSLGVTESGAQGFTCRGEPLRLLQRVGGTAVADVAAATGFADQAHLTRWFRRCYGITPGAYRAACA